MLVDESGFYPLAAVATTWAPVGQTLQNAIRRFKRRQTDLISAFFSNAGL